MVFCGRIIENVGEVFNFYISHRLLIHRGASLIKILINNKLLFDSYIFEVGGEYVLTSLTFVITLIDKLLDSSEELELKEWKADQHSMNQRKAIDPKQMISDFKITDREKDFSARNIKFYLDVDQRVPQKTKVTVVKIQDKGKVKKKKSKRYDFNFTSGSCYTKLDSENKVQIQKISKLKNEIIELEKEYDFQPEEFFEELDQAIDMKEKSIEKIVSQILVIESIMI
jgi:hypothetical protein